MDFHTDVLSIEEAYQRKKVRQKYGDGEEVRIGPMIMNADGNLGACISFHSPTETPISQRSHTHMNVSGKSGQTRANPKPKAKVGSELTPLSNEVVTTNTTSHTHNVILIA